MWKAALFVAALLIILPWDSTCKVYSNSWAVEVSGGDAVADLLAKRHGFTNLGRVGSLEGVYHFVHRTSPRRSRRSLASKHFMLMAEEQVKSVEQQVVLKRVKRDYHPPTDAKWPQQWYLHRKNGHHMNVELAWEQDIIGRGVVVSILDDGIEHTHPDLHDNYDPLASYDLNSHDADPFPRYDYSNENKHGTRCAGEVAANRNGKCGVGAAYGAKIGGVRMLDGDVTDVVESSSLSLNPQHIDIYSSSWGPTDDGRTVDGPGRLAKKAFLDGVTKGRRGLGSIFMWAAGNGGRFKDSCNCDGYAVSPYTISVGSVSERDGMPWYSEVCSSTLVSTYSSGDGSEKQIISTDLHKACTAHHTGTSASAPLAAGMVALALEANRNLTWRDLQYLLVYSSDADFPHDSWESNGVGLKVSHKFGFGVIDGAALVNRARNWITVPPQHNCTVDVTLTQRASQAGHPLTVSIHIAAPSCSLVYLEHVQAITTLRLTKGQRRGVHLKLTSPMKTTSILLPYRDHDYNSDGFHKWPFMTVHSWGEDPRGDWKFTVESSENAHVSLDSLKLVLFGTLEVPESVRSIPHECHSQCKGGCAGRGPQHCDVCKMFRVASSLECVEECPQGTYVDYHMCRDCPHLCAHCANDHTCIQCHNSALKLDNGLCAETCPELTYTAPNRSCLPCHHSCLSCNGPSNRSCTSCPGQFSLTVQGGCVVRSSCPAGQYYDGRALECRFCHKSCAKCSGREINQCTACFTRYALSGDGDGKCVLDGYIGSQRNCKEGEYYSDVVQLCKSCPGGCFECSDEITCVVCDRGHFLETRRVGESHEETRLCVTKCLDGFYGDAHTNSCQPCPSYCTTCNSPHDCTACTLNSTTKPVEGECPQPCHEKEYFSFLSRLCHPCLENCQDCTSGESCLHCQPGFFLTPSATCVSKCPDHMITDEEGHRCVDSSCHPSCLTCFGPEADQCISCSTSTGLIFHENSCLEDCPTHTFYDGSSCKHCSNSCASCAGPADDNCLSCPPRFLLDHYHCVSACPPGTFTSSGECLACSMHCASCSSINMCTVCEEGYVYYEPNRSCIQHCPDGYYLDSKHCVECVFPCSSCTEPRNCTVCSSGLAMDTDTGECEPCCKADPRGRQKPCCDCDRDERTCIWASSFAETTPTELSTHKKSVDPVAVVSLVIVLCLLLVTVVAGAVLLGVKLHQTRIVRYRILEKDPLEVVDDDSESDAEV